MISRINLILSSASLISVIILAVLFFTDRKNIVYVDSARLIGSYRGTVVAQESYRGKMAIWQANIDTLTQELDSVIANFKANKSGLSKSEKKLTEELIQVKRKQLMQYQQAMNDKARQEDAELAKKILGEINNSVAEYGKRHGYEIILAATEYGNLGYGLEELDITDEILEELNRKYGQASK